MDSAKEDVKKSNTSHMGFQDDGHIGHDLRENPKKSWKFSGFEQSTIASMQEPENQCKVCGKQFESLKALYGHMRHHSGRERRRIPCKECSKEFLSSKSLANHVRVHSQKLRVRNELRTSSSHDVAVKSLVVKGKRSVRKRYNFTASSSISSLNESLSVTEIDQEVKQAAICLMMLSRGGQDWGEFYAVGEYSDNDSITFEVKALNQKKRIVTNESGYFVANGNATLKMKKRREEKLDACVSECLIVLYEMEEDEHIEMDSGAESYEEEKPKLEVSTEKFYKGSEFEMLKLDDGTGSESSDSEIEEILGDVKFKSTQVESSEDLMKEVGLDETGLGILTSTSSKEVNFHACDTEYGGDLSTKVISSDYEILDDSQKTFKIKCKTCDKVFCSRRALGGHQRMHSTRKRFIPLKTENSEKQHQTTIFPETEDGCKLVKVKFVENLAERKIGETSVKGYESRESKEHKCHICLKVFATGQALGGHKRAHIGKHSKTEECYSDICNELDLNVPVMLMLGPSHGGLAESTSMSH